MLFRSVQVLHQTGQHLLQARVGRGGKAGDDRLGDVVLVEVAHRLVSVGRAVRPPWRQNVGGTKWKTNAAERKDFSAARKKTRDNPETHSKAMDRWTEIELFVQVAETGSLSRAAEALNLSNASASRHLAALEERLGVRLVERNTRRLYLTDTGQEFFQRARNILSDLRDAESDVNAAALNPTGLLRVTASLSFSMHHIAPLLREFTERYPHVSVHVEAANRYLDIIDNNIDVAIRTREYEPDSNITIRRLGQTRLVDIPAQAEVVLHASTDKRERSVVATTARVGSANR